MPMISSRFLGLGANLECIRHQEFKVLDFRAAIRHFNVWIREAHR